MTMTREALRPGDMFSGPLYVAVKKCVTKSLMAGEWEQGAPIPSEAQLASRYAVSVGTVRKAIGELVDEKVLVRWPGRGTFTAKLSKDHMLDVFFRIVDAEGQKEFPASTAVSFRRMKADPVTARHLRLKPGARILCLENLLSLQGRPAIFDRIRIPQAVFPDFNEKDFNRRTVTIFAFYQSQFGVTVTRLDEWIRAGNADARLANSLGLAIGAAVLKIERVAYTYDGAPVEFRERVVDTRRHAYFNTLGMKQT